jgi:serine/threonine protein kinase
MAFALRLAITLSTAIGHLHQRCLIHKDIKPANILVDSATGLLRPMPRRSIILSPVQHFWQRMIGSKTMCFPSPWN